jgi:hypothetical protein
MEFKGTFISYEQHFSHTCHKIMWHMGFNAHYNTLVPPPLILDTFKLGHSNVHYDNKMCQDNLEVKILKSVKDIFLAKILSEQTFKPIMLAKAVDTAAQSSCQTYVHPTLVSGTLRISDKSICEKGRAGGWLLEAMHHKMGSIPSWVLGNF